MIIKKKNVLANKLFANGLSLDFPQRAQVEKTVHGMEAYWLSGEIKNNNNLGGAFSKEGHADIFFWRWTDPSRLIYLQKKATAKSAFYCQLLLTKFLMHLFFLLWIEANNLNQEKEKEVDSKAELVEWTFWKNPHGVRKSIWHFSTAYDLKIYIYILNEPRV